MKRIATPIVLTFLLLISFASNGQYTVYKKNKSYLALIGGFNYSIPDVTDRYGVLSGTNTPDAETNDKDYVKFGKNNGTQFGIRYSFNFLNTLSAVIGFGYQTQSFNYRTYYTWSDSISNQNFEREMYHKQQLSYFTVPIMARWDLTERQLKPYVQGGLFMDFRHQAGKIISYDNMIDEQEMASQASSSGWGDITANTQKFNMGLLAGAGVHYYTKYVTFGVETNFRYGVMKVVNDEMRYADQNDFALQYLDVLDQLKLSALNIQFSLSVPISNSVTYDILRKSRYKRKQ